MMKITDFFSKKKRIFISYRQETSLDFVNHFADRLDDKFEVYYDQKHSEAELVSETIMQEIDQCTHFILVVDKKTFTFDFENENENDNRLNAEDGEIYDYVLAEIRYVREKNEQKKKNKEDEIKIITLCVPGSEEAIEKFKREKKENKDENKNEIKTIIKDLLGINRHTYSKNETFDDFFKKFLEQKMGYDFAVERWKKILKISLLAIFTIALLVFGETIFQQWISSRTPKLVFAGGGSVAKLIKEITDDAIDIKNYPNSIYLNLPSKDAWALMPQELLTSHTSDGNKFYPVCLSALAAKDSVFTQTVYNIDDFKELGTIIEYKFKNEDILKVFVDSTHKRELDSLCLINNGRILKDSLKTKIEKWCKNPRDPKKPFKIYITRERSGTYCIYEDLFPDIFKDSLKRKDNLTFYDDKLSITDLKNNGNNYIVLSSHYYTPDSISKLCSIGIVESGKILSKSMYLYFVAYRDPNKYVIGNRYIIPDEMVRFFKRIENDITIAPIMSNNDEWKVITPIETLNKYEQKNSKVNTKSSKSK